jgi:hypothetical protein
MWRTIRIPVSKFCCAVGLAYVDSGVALDLDRYSSLESPRICCTILLTFGDEANESI